MLRMCTAQCVRANMNRAVRVFPVSTSEQAVRYAVYEFHFSDIHETETWKQTAIFWEVRTWACR